MNTCEKCKYWFNEYPNTWNEVINPIDPDTCERMKDLPFEVRYCTNPKIAF